MEASVPKLHSTNLNWGLRALKLSSRDTQFFTPKASLLQWCIHCCFFFLLLLCGVCQRRESMGLSQFCSGQSVSVWLTARGTINCPAAQQECQGERAAGEGEDESRAMPGKRDEAHRGLSGNSPNMALLINLIPSASFGLLSLRRFMASR